MEKGAHSKRLRASINQIAQVAIDLSVNRGKSALTILKADKRRPDALNRPLVYWNDGLDVAFETETGKGGNIDLGGRVKQIRNRQSMPQKELAALVGVTPSTISQIESGTIYPSLPALFKNCPGVEPAGGGLLPGPINGGRPGGVFRRRHPDQPLQSAEAGCYGPPSESGRF